MIVAPEGWTQGEMLAAALLVVGTRITGGATAVESIAQMLRKDHAEVEAAMPMIEAFNEEMWRTHG